MPRITVTSDDGTENTIDVPASAIELTEDESPTDLPGVQKELNRIAGKTRKQAKSQAQKDLLEDDSFWQKQAKRRGVDLREDDLMPKGASKGEVKELKKELAKAKAKASKVDDLQEQMQKARDTRLENELLKHADGVKDDMKDLFLQDAKRHFAYDDSDDQFVPTTEEGDLDYAKSTEDVLAEIRENRPSMFKATNANGTGTNAGASPGSKWSSPEAWQNADTSAMTDEEFQEWRAAAPK